MPTPVENSELRAKGESMDLTPQNSNEAFSALDNIMADEAKKQGATDADIVSASTAKPVSAAAPSTTKDLDDSAAQVEIEEKAVADKVAADKVAADKVAADAAAAAADPAKVAAEKAAAEKAAATTAAKDDFDKIELPPHSSAKAGESFAALKKAARDSQVALQAQLAERDTKLVEATGELEKLRKVSGQVPEGVTKELEELRRFRVAHDVESDPSFTKFKSEIIANDEAIYNKLKQAGYSEENIARIKELGGPGHVAWEQKNEKGLSLIEQLPTQTRLFLHGKLVANMDIADKRDAALEAAKSNGQKFLQERAEKDSGELLNKANEYLTKLSWTAQKSIPATATPEQKSAIEAENKSAIEAMDTVKMYLSDRSPARHAELAIGTLLAHRYQSQLMTAEAKLTANETAHKTALETLTKERDTLKTELDAIKRAEIPRSEHNLSTITPAAKKGSIDTRSGAEALDALAAEYTASANR